MQARYESRLKRAYHDIDVARIQLHIAKQNGDDYEEEKEELDSLLEGVKTLKLAMSIQAMTRQIKKMGRLGILPGQSQKRKRDTEGDTE